ncbi:MAG: response regulator [Actinobacteria bacterium]|nr:response regulator [Actinomycetota bacterium]
MVTPLVESSAVSILVVDDDADHRSLVARALEPLGHTVRFAASGAEALAVLDGVDLVVLDYRLPDTSGMDLLTAIKARNGPSVVMVTAMGSESVAVDAMRLGAVDYLVKGGDYVVRLPQVVERACRQHDLARRASELQRVALVVHSARDRAEVYREIVQGARTLLRAGSAALFVVNGAGAIEMLEGDADGAARIAARLAGLLATGGRAPAHIDDRALVVPLSEAEGKPSGALVVWDDAARRFEPEEVTLVETFAAFAGTALANAARLELERALVVQLQDTLDLRRSFAMSLSHELRTPLTCVVGFAETLLGNWDRLDERARYDCVVAVRDNATQLRGLVEQLLDFGSLEAGRLTATPVLLDLRAEIEAAVQAMAPMFADRPVTTDVGEVRVHGDPVLLRRVLSNLLSNAAKYSGPGSPVSVRVVDENDGMVCVEVVDEGAGISAEEATHVFEPFWRSSTAQLNATRGSGIGLALVREYVRLMGGSVGVRSTPGLGASFSFTLPRAD